MFDYKDIEKLRNALSIEEVIGKRISIQKKSSHSYVGICPFHNDSHPSMQIHTGKQIFKCFSCGAGGDVFKFVADFEHISFPEAVELLAKEAGLQIQEQKQDGTYNKREKDSEVIAKIKVCNEYAMGVYHQYLMKHSEAKEARRYLLSRKISVEMIKRYHIGYAPKEFRFLSSLFKNRYPKEALEQSGLFSLSRQGDFVDFFRGRIMFPIISEREEVLGFGGRILNDNKDEAKYMNTRETPIFFKHNVLYGLNYSKTLIHESKKIFVVEGYLDVIACLEAGLGAVAPLGTALTESHLRKLKRFDAEIYFLFDGDSAGEKAAIRACKTSLSLGLMTFTVIFENKMDPFDVVMNEGKEVLKEIVEKNKKTSVEYLLEIYASKWYQKNEYEKANGIRELSSILASMSDDVLKEQVLQTFSKRLNVEADIFRGKTPKPPERQKQNIEVKSKNLSNEIRMQRRLVIFLIVYPEFIKDAMSLFFEEDFEEDVSSFLYKQILSEISKGEFDLHLFLQKLDEKTKNYVERQIFQMEDLIAKSENKERFFHGLISRLKEEGIKKRIKLAKEKIANTKNEEESKVHREEMMRLLAERNRLIHFFSKNKS